MGEILLRWAGHCDRPCLFSLMRRRTRQRLRKRARCVSRRVVREKWLKFYSRDLINAAMGRITRFADSYFHS